MEEEIKNLRNKIGNLEMNNESLTNRIRILEEDFERLKKAQLDQKLAGKAEEIENTPVGEGKALDRNELLKMLNSKQDDK